MRNKETILQVLQQAIEFKGIDIDVIDKLSNKYKPLPQPY